MVDAFPLPKLQGSAGPQAAVLCSSSCKERCQVRRRERGPRRFGRGCCSSPSLCRRRGSSACPGLPMSMWWRRNLKDLQTTLCLWHPSGSPTLPLTTHCKFPADSLIGSCASGGIHISKCSGRSFLNMRSLFTFQVNWLLCNFSSFMGLTEVM